MDSFKTYMAAAALDWYRKALGPGAEARAMVLDWGTAEHAYLLAASRGRGQGARDLREKACTEPEWAFMYALKISLPRDDRTETREAACRSPKWAAEYARRVDQGPHDDTRTAVCRVADKKGSAYYYALDVDKGPHDETRAAACSSGPEWAYKYAAHVDKCARNDTRVVAYRDPTWERAYYGFEVRPLVSTRHFYADIEWPVERDRCGDHWFTACNQICAQEYIRVVFNTFGSRPAELRAAILSEAACASPRCTRHYPQG